MHQTLASPPRTPPKPTSSLELSPAQPTLVTQLDGLGLEPGHFSSAPTRDESLPKDPDEPKSILDLVQGGYLEEGLEPEPGQLSLALARDEPQAEGLGSRSGPFNPNLAEEEHHLEGPEPRPNAPRLSLTQDDFHEDLETTQK